MDRKNLVFLVVGIVLLVGTIYSIYWRLGFLNRCVETRATVIDIEWERRHTKDGWEEMGYTVFQFTDQRSGKEVEARGEIGSSSPSHSIGDEVNILYDPQHLGASVVVKSWLNIWGLPIVLGIMGSAFTSVGILTISGHIP